MAPVCAPADAGVARVATPTAVAAANDAGLTAATDTDVTSPRARDDAAALARFFPGPDEASSGAPRARKTTAVLLFAPPMQEQLLEPGLTSVPSLAFQPVACSIGGKLQSGVRCGEAMPARAKVRLTSSGTPQEITLHRSTTAFHDEGGGQDFPAPYAPACCMYNTCVGKTIPYLPAEKSGVAFYTTKPILAVWPHDADIDLEPLGPDTYDAAAPPPYRANAGPRALYVIAKSDVDGDGRRELLVFERWANDYGLAVLAAEKQPPLYRFSCGNI